MKIGRCIIGTVSALAVAGTIVVGCTLHNAKKIRKFNEDKKPAKKSKK